MPALAVIPHEHTCPGCRATLPCSAPSCAGLTEYPCVCCRVRDIEARPRFGESAALPVTPEMWATAKRWAARLRGREFRFRQPGTGARTRQVGFVAEQALVAFLAERRVRFEHRTPTAQGLVDQGDLVLWYDGKGLAVDVKAREQASRPNLLVACVQVDRHPWPLYLAVEVREGHALWHGWATLEDVRAAPRRLAGQVPAYELPYARLRPWRVLLARCEGVVPCSP
jgi:hypothetical protein